jgi:radical SAM protein with 4Fe4S-binding SPASM domain
LGLKEPPQIIQIEACGICNISCEYCNYKYLPRNEKIMMEPELLRKVTREAIRLLPDQVSYHVYGESLLNPHLLQELPKWYPIVLSTNGLALTHEKAEKLAKMRNLVMILGIAWCEPEERLGKMIENCLYFLDQNPVCRYIPVQMVCSVSSIKHARRMYDTFSPYLEKIPTLQIKYFPPLTRGELGYVPGSEKGFEPEGIPCSDRVTIETGPTPRHDCDVCTIPDAAGAPPNTLVIKATGDIRMCNQRGMTASLGNAHEVSLKQAWDSDLRQHIIEVWRKRDPDNEIGCYNCLMAKQVIETRLK